MERITTTDIEKRSAAAELPPLLSELAEELSSRLKKANVRAEILVIITKTSSFQRHTYQQRLLVPGNEKEVLEVSARELFSALLGGEDGLFSGQEALRPAGIDAARLEDPQYQQLSPFSLPSVAEVRETKACAAAEAAEIEKHTATVMVQAKKHRKFGEMQTTTLACYGDKVLLCGGALLSAERNEIPNTQVKSRQQGAEIKEP